MVFIFGSYLLADVTGIWQLAVLLLANAESYVAEGPWLLGRRDGWAEQVGEPWGTPLQFWCIQGPDRL